ncbi:transposase [Legionella dresdenensis]|uniref:Transposase n=1 Tax=Legionella dresdenensis TaxID=450200 RepID=A0ABV8CGT1_9GAMM
MEAFELTDLGTQDWEGLEALIKKLDEPVSQVTGDGAYNQFPSYALAEEKQFKLIAPPPANARISQERKDKINKKKQALLIQRDETIEKVRQFRRKEWKIASGYHQRSLVETSMFRIKALLGDKLSAKLWEKHSTLPSRFQHA